MKKKYLSRKKILTFLLTIISYLSYGFIKAISSDINFWKALSNLPIKIFNLLLLLLFVKIPFWIILSIALISFILIKLINKRLNEEQEYILSMAYNRELGLNTFFRGCKKRFPEKASTISNTIAIIKKLEKLKLIELGCYSGGVNSINEEHYKIAEKGKRRRKKIKNITESEIENIITEIMQERDNIENETNTDDDEEMKEEMVFILNILASKPNRTASYSDLNFDYKNNISDNDANFQILIGLLEDKNYIYKTECGEFGEIGYTINNSGLRYLRQNR